MKTIARGVVLVAVLLLVLPAVATAITPIDGGSVSETPLTVINNGPDDQSDPHVSGDLVCYRDDFSSLARIRYYRFSTGADAAIPLDSGLADVLCDVSGNRISFSRVLPNRTALFIFDTTNDSLTEIDPTTGSNRSGSAIGGNTVAYVDYATGGSGDIFVIDLAGSSPSQPLGLSPSIEQNPNVSPDGNVVVWELCPISLANCDVMKSVRTGTTWSPAEAVANSASTEGNPDTDGTDIVYDADLPGSATGKDIYLVPVSGGPPMQLAIPGSQNNPSISQGVIAFETTLTGTSDIFIYVIATNTMFRVTDTPSVNETLTDISVLPNGDVRVVWAADDGPVLERNIYARTFRVPLGTPAQMIADLIDETLIFLERMPLAAGLRARLEQVASALVANNHALACWLLNLYIAAVNATRSGGRLTAAEKATLVADARAIKAAIGCP